MKEGKVLNSSFFVFRYIKQNTPQYAFVAPKSIAKMATKRNKLRRRGYNIIRSLPIKSVAGIFFYKKQGVEAKIEEVKKDILFLLNNIK